MTSEPSDILDPDGDPQMMGEPGTGEVDTTPSVDGVRETTPVQDDPDDQDEPDADPGMLASTT